MDVKIITDFLHEKLGFKMRECVKAPDKSYLAGWMSVTPLVHDIAVSGDPDIHRQRIGFTMFLTGWTMLKICFAQRIF